jgi:hypothetical protein
VTPFDRRKIKHDRPSLGLNSPRYAPRQIVAGFRPAAGALPAGLRFGAWGGDASSPLKRLITVSAREFSYVQESSYTTWRQDEPLPWRLAAILSRDDDKMSFARLLA